MTPPNSSASGDASIHSDDRRATPELAQPGDWVEVDGVAGAGPRRGEVLEVIGSGHHLHFRVRWDEEHESLLYPAPEGGVVVHAKKPSAKP
jgi:hypothetical protein